MLLPVLIPSLVRCKPLIIVVRARLYVVAVLFPAWQLTNHLARLLGCVNLLGTTFETSTIATGYGAYLAQPILREAVEGKEAVLTESDAKAILEKCMTVLWYRDARSTDQVKSRRFLICSMSDQDH